MADDFVKGHGYLTLGTRLKRLGERMQSDVADVSTELGMPTAAGLLTAIAAIEANGGTLTVSGLTEALGVSQPAATKLAARLVADGLVSRKIDRLDKRARILTATPAGRSLVESGQRLLWPAVEAAVRDLCADTSGSLIERIEAVESSLAEMSLSKRIRRKLMDETSKQENHDAAS